MPDEPVGTPEGGEGTSAGTQEAPSYEERARSGGWRPKEEFEGGQDSWVDAEEFVKRKPLFERIKSQSKELKEMKSTINSMANHFQKATATAVNKAISELNKQRHEAIELGKVEDVDAIDAQIAEQKAIVVEAPKGGNVPSEIREWIAENPWFEKDEELQIFAQAHNDTYLRRHPGNLAKSLEETTKATKKAFPEKFEKKPVPPSPVEGGGAPKGASKKYVVDRLTSEQRQVYKQLVTQNKVMEHDEYFKSLEEMGELK
jgi:hypothetical protein